MLWIQLGDESSRHFGQHCLEFHLGEASADAIARTDAERKIGGRPDRLVVIAQESAKYGVQPTVC